VKTGEGEVLIGARWLELASPSAIRLRSPRAYASAVERHHDDVALAHDVLDRQVVDADGVQILRPADLYLAAVEDRIELVGIEVGLGALARRLGPKRLRSRATRSSRRARRNSRQSGLCSHVTSARSPRCSWKRPQPKHARRTSSASNLPRTSRRRRTARHSSRPYARASRPSPEDSTA